MPKEIIINADDFGLKSSVNKAIVESFKAGTITSTTLMANMPGFDEAIQLAYENDLLSSVGIHLNLTGGVPLTEAIRNTNLFYNEKNSDLKKHKKNLFRLTTSDRALVFNEFSAQIERVKNAGIQITHIDTHHHIDEIWSITQIIQELLKKYNIPSMRILNNMNQSTRFHKKMYRKLVNRLIRMNHANYTDFLGNQLEAVNRLVNDPAFCENKKLEIMVHPDYNNAGLIIDRINKMEFGFDYPEQLAKYIVSHKRV
jgi:chitin disaccharide deacetylase